MVALGRQSLADGQLPRKFAEDWEKDIRWCTTYDREYSRALMAIREADGTLAAKRT